MNGLDLPSTGSNYENQLSLFLSEVILAEKAKSRGEIGIHGNKMRFPFPFCKAEPIW